MDFELSNKCACVLAEVMENFDDFAILKHLLKTMWERVYLGEIEDITVAAQSNL